MDDSSHQVVTAIGKIRDRNGLHLKVASDISRACAKLDCHVRISRDEKHSADARSPLALLTLGAAADVELQIRAEGADAHQAIQELSAFILFLS